MLIQQTQTSERILYLLESSYPEPQQALKPLGMRRYPIATGNIWREFDELSMGLNRLKSERHEEFERFCLDARKHTVLPRTDVDITALWSKVFRQVGFKVEIVSPSELLDPLEELREPIKSDFILLWDSRDHRETERAFVNRLVNSSRTSEGAWLTKIPYAAHHPATIVDAMTKLFPSYSASLTSGVILYLIRAFSELGHLRARFSPEEYKK